jgi:hypothetical protein
MANNEKYPPVRFKRELKETLQGRADSLAKERGLGAEDISLPAYLAEASQFFEDNRPKAEASNGGAA